MTVKMLKEVLHYHGCQTRAWRNFALDLIALFYFEKKAVWTSMAE